MNNVFVLEEISRQYVQDRRHEARQAQKAKLAELIRRSLNKLGR